MTIEEKLKNLPNDPGVYIMRDSTGNILYVGKAKNLKNRVKQYFFTSKNRNIKVKMMLTHVADFEYIITESETDALSLENNLIKQHKPPYNILLKDDKQYPYLKINVKDDFPKISVTRKLVYDDSKYFGPLMGGSIRDTMRLLEYFPTITCNYDMNNLPKSFRPCLNSDIGRCSSPCTGRITKEEYRKIIDRVIDFLNGNDKEVRRAISERMALSAQNLQFEKALLCRQQLSILDNMQETRLVNTGDNIDADVYAIASNGRHTAVGQLVLRGGKLIGAQNYAVTDGGLDLSQTLSGFLSSYYAETNLDTKRIYLNIDLPDREAIGEMLGLKYGKKISITVPRRSLKRKIVEMAEKNALIYLDKSQTKLDKEFNSTIGAMEHLKESLSLDDLPRRVECYDISNVSGVDKVASMVVFTNGEKDSKSYRRYRIKTVEGANDFASMKEVLYRRLLRLKENDFDFGARPDLIVVDGGKGQLSSAVEAMEKANVFVPIASLAKREEWVYVPNSSDPIILPRGSFGLNLLINIRDEAHRFAITYFRGLHNKNILVSELDSIAGVGKKRSLALMKRFGSIDAIAAASVETIAETDGVDAKTAQAIYDHFNSIACVSPDDSNEVS